MKGEAIAAAAANIIQRRRADLDNDQRLLDTLSPQATLLRGYSITRINGHAVKSAAEITAGDTLETTLATGTITSTAL